MTTLHLGVLDIPYSEPPAPPRRKATIASARRTRINPRSTSSTTKSTGDVAEILEARYHVMEMFYHLREEYVANALAESVRGALENLVLGAPSSVSMTAEAESDIIASFKKFLSMREMDALGYPGIPTRASLEGVSHRFARPHERRASRPSFIDTGLYQSSFRAWVD